MRRHFSLAPIFDHNMVFQANKPIRIYGSCKKHIDISVKFLGQEKKIRTKDNHFVIELDPEDYHDKGFSFVVESRKHIETIYNCLIGDVFLMVGGKNVSQTIKKSSKEIDYTSERIRFYQGKKKQTWLHPSKDSLDEISVLAYLFSKHIHIQKHMPIGIITYAKDDESIFSWSNPNMIMSDKDIKNYVQSIFQAKKHELGRDYQFLKKHLFLLSFKSILLYQGENDFQHIHFYEKALRLLIKTYRTDLRDTYLPFYIIQMPSFESKDKHYIASSEIRIAQSNACSDEHQIYVVSVVDIDEKDIVSINKSILSKRLANMILEKQYRLAKNASCPQLFSYQQRPGQVDIYIHQNFLSLVSRSGQKLGFYYGDDRGQFYPVKDVSLTNNQISLKIKENAKEIRYAYDDNPTCDIYTSNGLPLLPFKILLDKAS